MRLDGDPLAVRKSGRLSRLTAAIFDLVILGLILAGILRMGLRPWWFIICWIIYIEVGYRCGGSLGKLLLGLRVAVPNRRTHLFREIIGKLASVATFGVGFALVLTKERSAMHDYMAKTTVMKGGVPFRGSQAVAILVLAAVGLVAAYRSTIAAHKDNPTVQTLQNDDFIQRVTRQTAAVGTVYTFGRAGVPIGQGSAFVLTSDGLAATNLHVLEGAFSANCQLGDGRLFHVLAVQGFNATQDVAIFQLGRKIGERIELPSALVAVRLGSSAAVGVGDRVATISSPKGLSNTISDGLVSSIRQEGKRRLIQTTAPISNGSSGAPLFNTKGEVIGLTTSQMREGQNLNFAVPIEAVAELLQRRDDLALEDFQASLAPPQPSPAPRPTLTVDDIFQRANADFNAGRYREALKGYKRAQELDLTESAAWYNAARCYIELGDQPNAARMYYIYLLSADENDVNRESVVRWLSEMKFPIPQH